MRESAPVQHTEPCRHEGREDIMRRLEGRLERIAGDINDVYSDLLVGGNRKPKVVDDLCHINMRAFTRSKFGGPYEQGAKTDVGSIRFDEQQVYQKKIRFSGALDPAVQQRLGTNDVDQIIAEHEHEERTRSGPLAEMGMLHLFHKFFGDEFLVVRASEHDDYNNGVDMLLVDRQTGEVLCTFDDVVGEVNGERYQNKKDKQKDLRKRKEGADVKYGLTMQENDTGETELVRTALRGIPVYTVRIDPTQLVDFLNRCDYEQTTPTQSEREMLEQVLADLEEQEREDDVSTPHVARLRALLTTRA